MFALGPRAASKDGWNVELIGIYVYVKCLLQFNLSSSVKL